MFSNAPFIGNTGHQKAWKAGILHRDISFGNVMVAPSDEDFRGFIHDFDYSSFECGEEEPIPPLYDGRYHTDDKDEHHVSDQGEIPVVDGIDDQSSEAIRKKIDEERQ
jgi:hypothetical protein